MFLPLLESANDVIFILQGLVKPQIQLGEYGLCQIVASVLHLSSLGMLPPAQCRQHVFRRHDSQLLNRSR